MMRPTARIVRILILFVLLSARSFSQGSTAIPFLLISSSAQANAMGEASVADHTDDPFSPLANPAHLGAIVSTNYFSGGYVSTPWLPSFGVKDLTYAVYAANAGFNLQQVWKDGPALHLGIGYSNVRLNLGTFTLTSENGPDIIGTFQPYENSDQYSFGAGYEYFVRVSAGTTIKYVRSILAPIGPSSGSTSAKTTLYDYGVLLDAPLVDIALKLARPSADFENALLPYADVSVGIAKNNLGRESISYADPNQADPLPRCARAGVGVDMGLVLTHGDALWKPLSFKWNIESSDLLFTGNRPRIEYQSGLGDIKFFDEVVLGKTNARTVKKKGWEVNLMEIVALRGGRFEENVTQGNRRFTTKGWGFRLAGVTKMLRTMFEPNEKDALLRFLVDHVDIRIDHSELNADDPHSTLAGTKFDAVSLTIMN